MHICGMRSHREIVNDAGADWLAAKLGVSVNTSRSWARRDSIPAEHWLALVEARKASLGDLARYAAAKRTQVAA